MKRIITFLIVCAFLLSVGGCALAAGSAPDEWYAKRAADLVPDGGSYKVNAPEGYATAWRTPEEERPYGNIPNGTVLKVEAVYEGWSAVAYVTPEGQQARYWLASHCLTPHYTSDGFIAEHTDELSDALALRRSMKYYVTKGTVYLYTYPGSGVISAELDGVGLGFDLGPVFEYVYIDAEGRSWGYLTYYCDWKYDAWICITDPENPELFFDGTGAELYPAAETVKELELIHYEIALHDYTQRNLIIILGAVVLAVLISAVLFVKKQFNPHADLLQFGDIGRHQKH